MNGTLKMALRRYAREVPIWSKSSTQTEDEFGQDVKSWSKLGEVLVARSYQNRNTTQNNSAGERHRDRPVFFFAKDQDIRGGSRIKYEGGWYELDAPTQHHTHTVAVGSKVIDEDFPP